MKRIKLLLLFLLVQQVQAGVLKQVQDDTGTSPAQAVLIPLID